MRWKYKERPEWRSWWAWYPVCTDHELSSPDTWVWLEWVEYKPKVCRFSLDWTYRLPLTVSKGG